MYSKCILKCTYLSDSEPFPFCSLRIARGSGLPALACPFVDLSGKNSKIFMQMRLDEEELVFEFNIKTTVNGKVF